MNRWFTWLLSAAAVSICIIAIAGFGTLAVIFSGWMRSYWNPSPVVVSSGPTVAQVQKMQELVTGKFVIADTLTYFDGDYRGAWLVRGDALIATDLKHAQFGTHDDKSRKATIYLPRPRVVSSRVDHEKTSMWDIKKVTWVPFIGESKELRDKAMVHAQRAIQRAAQSDEHIDQAKLQAEHCIKALYGGLGWDVSVEWPKDDDAVDQKTDKSSDAADAAKASAM